MMLLLLALGCMDAPCADVEGAKVFVHWDAAIHSGDARTFASIQDALDAAQGKSAVCVAGGAYHETLVAPHGSRLHAAQGTELLGDGVLVRLEGDAVVAGLTLADADVAVELAPWSQVELVDLVIQDNRQGVIGRDAELSVFRSQIDRNPGGGVQVSGQDAVVRVHSGRVSGNGAPTSTFGGVWSGGALELSGTTLRDNAGLVASDAYSRGALVVRDTRIERALVVTGPRLRADAGADIVGLDAQTPGGVALRVACDGVDADLQNVAILHSGAEPPLHVEGCAARLWHGTLVQLGEPVAPLASELPADWTNSAAAGFSPIDAPSLWQGSVTDAGLLRATQVDPDLRPRPESDWVDAGEPTELATDLDGRPRTAGAAPDLGAWEAY
jgi:hypothetical protein